MKMAKENDIKEELLKQMDSESHEKAETHASSLDEIIAKDRARIKRLKWATVISWVLVAFCLIPAAFLEHARRSAALIPSELVVLSTLAVTLRALLLIAVILTISLYIRSRTLTIHQIQARLANIEELLKKMSQDKQPPDKT